MRAVSNSMGPRKAGGSGLIALALWCAPFTASTVRAMDGVGVSAHRPSVALGMEWTPMDPQRLDGIRGGFQLPGGPVLSFGIERVVEINGRVVANLSLRIPDVARITPEQAAGLAEFRKGVIVQVGEGNRIAYGNAPAGGFGGIVIQNSLDNQTIGIATRIDVGVDMLGLFQGRNFADSINTAVIGFSGP